MREEQFDITPKSNTTMEIQIKANDSLLYIEPFKNAINNLSNRIDLLSLYLKDMAGNLKSIDIKDTMKPPLIDLSSYYRFWFGHAKTDNTFSIKVKILEIIESELYKMAVELDEYRKTEIQKLSDNSGAYAQSIVQQIAGIKENFKTGINDYDKSPMLKGKVINGFRNGKGGLEDCKKHIDFLLSIKI